MEEDYEDYDKVKRAPRVLNIQKQRLVQLLENYFISKVGRTFHVQDVEITYEKWRLIADDLNSLGPMKDAAEWKLAFNYMKNRVKNKAMKELSLELNETDEKIRHMFGSEWLSKEQDKMESAGGQSARGRSARGRSARGRSARRRSSRERSAQELPERTEPQVPGVMLDKLITFVDENFDILVGRFSGPDGVQLKKQLWEGFAAELYELGASKTAAQWHKTFNYVKASTKSKLAEIRQCERDIGDLDERDRKIISMFGMDLLDGHQNIGEGGFTYDETVPLQNATTESTVAGENSGYLVDSTQNLETEDEFMIDILDEPNDYLFDQENVDDAIVDHEILLFQNETPDNGTIVRPLRSITSTVAGENSRDLEDSTENDENNEYMFEIDVLDLDGQYDLLVEHENVENGQLDYHENDTTSGPMPIKCDLCGVSIGNVRFKCQMCDKQTFCASCDQLYHRHPNRNSHIREILSIQNTRPSASSAQARSVSTCLLQSKPASTSFAQGKATTTAFVEPRPASRVSAQARPTSRVSAQTGTAPRVFAQTRTAPRVSAQTRPASTVFTPARRASSTFGQPRPSASSSFAQPRSSAPSIFAQPRPSTSSIFAQQRPSASSSFAQPRPSASSSFAQPQPSASTSFAQTRPSPSSSFAQTRPSPSSSSTFGQPRPSPSATFTHSRPSSTFADRTHFEDCDNGYQSYSSYRAFHQSSIEIEEGVNSRGRSSRVERRRPRYRHRLTSYEMVEESLTVQNRTAEQNERNHAEMMYLCTSALNRLSDAAGNFVNNNRSIE